MSTPIACARARDRLAAPNHAGRQATQRGYAGTVMTGDSCNNGPIRTILVRPQIESAVGAGVAKRSRRKPTEASTYDAELPRSVTSLEGTSYKPRISRVSVHPTRICD